MTELLCQPSDVLAAWPQFGQLPGPEQTALIEAASTEIINFCRRPGFVQATYDEFYDGPQGPRLWLKQVPVLQVAAVQVNGTALDNTLGSAWHFKASTGELIRGRGSDFVRFGAYWPAGQGNIEVVYSAGFTEYPEDLVRAAILMVRWLHSITKRPMIYDSESIGDYSFKLIDARLLFSAIPGYIQALLNPYAIDDGPM
jgi:hypothetical protein